MASLIYNFKLREGGMIMIADIITNPGKEDLLLQIAKAIRLGADVNARGRSGHTPLTIAASRKEGEIVELLLKNGADTTILDGFGNSALSCTKAGSDLYNMLSEARAKAHTSAKMAPTVADSSEEEWDVPSPNSADEWQLVGEN